MELIISLFVWGFLICAAVFVFQLVIGIVFTVIGGVIGGIAFVFTAVVDKIRGK